MTSAWLRDSNGCPVREAPRNTPAIHPAISINPQRNCPARKNAATGSIQRYHTPCTNVQMAISGAIHNTVHHLGGDEPCACQTKRMVSSPAMVTMNGRPSENRIQRSDASTMANQRNQPGFRPFQPRQCRPVDQRKQRHDGKQDQLFGVAHLIRVRICSGDKFAAAANASRSWCLS